MRKISLALGVLLGTSLLLGSVSANGSYQSEFAPVQTSTTFGLQAKSFDSYVQLQWSPITNTQGFVYYKVVRSQSNASPAYPDDGYIQYSSDASLSSYKDEKPLSGKTFYRVCAIYDTNASGQRPRICSNVVTITRDGSSVSPVTDSSTQDKPVEVKKPTSQYELSQLIKKRLDTLIMNFQKSLDKRDITNTEKSAVIDKAIARYNNLASQTKLALTKKMALYMVEKLTLMKSQYAVEDTTEIESLLQGL